MSGKLDGKVGIITGGGSGLGREIALEWVANGAAVVLSSNVPEELETVAAECRELGGRAVAVAADVRSEEEMENLATRAIEEFGRIDLLMAGAGIAGLNRRGTAEMGVEMRDMTLEEWNRVISINLNGVFLASRVCIPHMIEAGGGSIMSITSATVREAARPMLGAYVVTKFGQEGLTKRLARELDRFDIRVNIFQPGGMTHTPILGDLYDKGWVDDRHQASVVRPVALYLASDESRLVTGRMLVADQFNRERAITACECSRCKWRPNPLEIEYYPIIAT